MFSTPWLDPSKIDRKAAFKTSLLISDTNIGLQVIRSLISWIPPIHANIINPHMYHYKWLYKINMCEICRDGNNADFAVTNVTNHTKVVNFHFSQLVFDFYVEKRELYLLCISMVRFSFKRHSNSCHFPTETETKF